MSHQSQNSKRPSNKRKWLSAERILLFVGLLGFSVFLAIIAFFFVPILRDRPQPAALNPVFLAPTPSPTFALPPTWTPSPTPEVIPTGIGTQVVVGVPTRIYTPRPTSLSGLPISLFIRTSDDAVIDLARIMQGESTGDYEAAYMVGWVAKNRLLHPNFGDTYYEVSSGFFGYLDGVQPNEAFMDIARRVIRDHDDPTNGALFALSRTDITNLGVPPGRADVAFHEWFFFYTWPLNGR